MDLEDLYPTGSSRPFVPPHCPLDLCPSRRAEAPFLWQKKGRYVRDCDQRIVQRFLCRTCGHYFSTQTFRIDYRLQKPTIQFPLFDTFISKVTQRQAARNLACTRKTVVHRLSLLSNHARAFHERALHRKRLNGGLKGEFQLDELETFENCRRLSPLTVPALIERRKYFVVHLEVAPLPSRGKLRPHELERKAERERTEGPRRSGSRKAVEKCFQKLAEVRSPDCDLVVTSDYKSTYPSVLRQVMPEIYYHVQHSSTAVRDFNNPLFPINHTFAMMRDGVSRLVRRSWGASKQRTWLECHAWVWVAYRNYIRGITNRAPFTTAGLAVGVVTKQFTKASFFEWRIFSTR